ncbi:MAG: OmpA family protein [Rhodobacteraceae bacterium]|nr:OmpA family protein [Paracoccaceae bacterium]
MTQSRRLGGHRRHFALVAALVAVLTVGSVGLSVPAARAQQSDAVSVDLGALDSVGQNRNSGRIVLTPPPGVTPVNQTGSSAIKLKPPRQAQRAPRKVMPAPPKPDEPKTASVETQAPAPMPVSEPVAVAAAPKPMPSEPEPAPVTPALAPPVPAETSSPAPVPSPAAVRSAATEMAGPAIPFGGTAPGEEQQTASLPSPDQTAAEQEGADTRSLSFAAGSSEVAANVQAEIQTLAGRMANDRSLRLQLLAYASDAENNTSRARRLALDRAVAVRNMLIDAGVERTRIEVRALGDQSDSGPPDRVDAVALQR